MMTLNDYRNNDGTLNLIKALDDMTASVQTNYYGDAVSYVLTILSLQQIKSRQVGAVILTNALRIAINGH